MPTTWQAAAQYTDIRYEKGSDKDAGIAKITINRPEVHNAFRPETVVELSDAFEKAREDTEVGVIVLTGEGPEAFCSGGDQRVRSGTGGGYVTARTPARLAGRLPWGASTSPTCTFRSAVCPSRWWRWWRDTRSGGPRTARGCDLTIAADNARFGQAGPRVGSFDGGFGASVLSRLVGPKKAKEIWFLCRQYSTPEALDMGLVNAVVPLDRLEEETVQWCREMLQMSPFALRLLKASFNADEDGLAGLQQLAHDANLLSTCRRRHRRVAMRTSRSVSPTSRGFRAGLSGPI